MSPHEEFFHRLLDESSALLAAPENADITIPDDELHREIIVPLLPAMLADAAIRGHWRGQHATGFVTRIGRHFENGEAAPRWLPADFEIHVTASYSAGADARALADTLLSEESLRDMTAALMNQLLDALWPSLAPAPGAEAHIEVAIGPAEIPAAVIPAPIIEETPAAAEPLTPPETRHAPPTAVVPEVLPTAIEPERAKETRPLEAQAEPGAPSRALIRALCGNLAASAVQRGFAANSAPHDASAAIVARRIVQRAIPPRKKKRMGSRAACLG